MKGYKTGPLFADNIKHAEILLQSALRQAKNGPVYIDVPEYQTEFQKVVEQYTGNICFACIRMYSQRQSDINHSRVFGITTFELG